MLATGLLATGLLLVLAVGCAAPTVGLDGGRLRACPESPNCVCSEVAPDSAAYVAPFAVPEGVEPAEAFARLARTVEGRAAVETREDGYLHAVFKTALLRFRDDFEARLDREAGLIHVRSASRLGYSDLGKNRKRIEALREAYDAAGR